jgi:uncharacterized membrane protein
MTRGERVWVRETPGVVVEVISDHLVRVLLDHEMTAKVLPRREVLTRLEKAAEGRAA